MRLPSLLLFIALLAAAGARAAVPASAPASASAPTLVLHGALTGADHRTYRSVPFDVPAGVERITIEFDYTGKDEHNVIDLGLLGPDGALRGWSGGNKRMFTISAVDATPSYLPTPIVAGRWALLLGVPNLRAHGHADYTAKLYFSMGLALADEPALLRQPLRAGPAWYRGDLHSHTGHSDGSCASAQGAAVPCPVFVTARAAQARGLDFLAVTDHNGVAHANTLRELQPYFDNVLLMPGRELTSFYGHANLFGTLAPVDFRVAGDARAGWNALLARLPAHALVSINHPVRPSGETCMGCGWDAATDMRRVQAIEAVNGADADTPYSGIPFWQRQLDAGLRITAIGGSDSHRPDEGALGKPTTVVYASALSQEAVIEAIRAGHVFVDVAGTRDRLLTLRARVGEVKAMMGDALAAPAGTQVQFTVRVEHAAQAQLQLLVDGKAGGLAVEAALDGELAERTLDWLSDGARHTVRAEVRDAQGKLLLLGNPIYLND